ncbi:MAG: TRAP transporter substrate-binding protein DctP [Sporichthyaceae bacterium]|nr:TRAP transporter substrate-binding protein DctP [Sporichthyaceae bacterium]
MTAAVLGLAVVVTGCNAQAGDRAGGNATKDVRVLTFAQPNDGEPPDQLVAWAEQVGRLSKGSLRIEFKDAWRLGEPGYETGTIEDVSMGKADMAWVGARAFDRAGVTSFQALVAPMLIDSHALQARVFDEGIPARMTDDLDALGVVGVGVLPGPMRKVLGVSKPFATPEDFAGAVIGMQDSGVAEQTLAALGATTRPMPSGARQLDGLDGYEQQLSSIWANHYELAAKFVTANVNLWPRPLVLFAGKKVFDSLSSEQRKALRRAVDESVQGALEASRSEDEEAVPELCQAGMRFPVATDENLRSLESAVQPVYDELNADPQTKATIDTILALKAEVGAGPDSATCSGQPSGSTRSSSDAIPDGTYEMTLTDDESRRCPGDEGNPGGPFELQLRNGEVQQYEQRGDQARELGWFGTYRVFRDRFELTESSSGNTLTALWSFDGKALTLSDMQNGACGDATVWTTHPWVLKQRAADPAASGLDGTFQTTLTKADWSSQGLNGPVGTFTQTYQDGIVTATEPDGDLAFRGTYTVFRDRVEIVTSEDTLVANWERKGDRLRFSDMSSGGCVDCGPYAVVFTSHPWVKVE